MQRSIRKSADDPRHCDEVHSKGWSEYIPHGVIAAFIMGPIAFFFITIMRFSK